MIKINILSPGFTSPNGSGFLFPLIKFKHTIKEFGYQISIQNQLRKTTTDCDILMIDSKYFKHMWSVNYTETLEIISSIAEKTTLIWCDQSDSTGTLHGQVLPYVHRYIKAQILKDKSEYTKNHYGSRIYTDHYHKNFGIQDKIPNLTNTVTKEIYLKKIHVSWNSGLMNYGWISPYIQQIRNFLPVNNLLFFAKPFNTAEGERTLDVSCRMGITYPRETVC